ncbi:hypothetical protein SAMD00024442_20_43 [Candidatus Symbiothrix dinenymphae]|nr:hypothetical protein SAMD00024442_20_43 [Candidatus Symbiothrix dinenymphae]
MDAMSKIHIGEAIRQKVKERGLHVTDFADAIYCTRANIYAIFKRKSIDIEQLKRISEVLNFDFLAIYSTPQPKYLVLLEVDEQSLQKFASDKSVILIKKIAE